MAHSLRLHIILALLLCLLTLTAGWLTQRFSIHVDITANARHSLTPATARVLSAIEGPVELIAVIGPDTQTRNAITALVQRYQTLKTDFSLRFINPETDPQAARDLEAIAGDELIVRHGGREQRLQTLSERQLTHSLRQLTRAGTRTLVFTTGHEERSPLSAGNDDWLLLSKSLASIGLISREQSLVSEPYISDDTDLLIIADARRSFFPGEWASINDYLQRGGHLLWLTETPTTSEESDMRFLADTLGVDTLPGQVVDAASQTMLDNAPDFVVLDRFPSHDVTRLLSAPVLLPQVRALSVTPLAGQTLSPLLQTPDTSWTETGELSGAVRFDPDTQEVAGPLLTGLTIERPLPGLTQRIAVIGDADFAASQFIGNGANQSFAESLILWLTGEIEATEFVTQRAPDSELNLSPRSIITLTVLCLFALPLSFLLIAVGLLVYRRRST